MERIIEQQISDVMADILKDYQSGRVIDKTNIYHQPDKKEVISIVESLMCIVYPGFFRNKSLKIYNMEHTLSMLMEDVVFHLNKQIIIALRYFDEQADKRELEQKAQNISMAFLKKIPEIREYLDTDLDAAYDGDPAANSKDEIIFAYPGLYAITVYRLAHVLYQLQVPLIPRIMTEHAHSITGIDINPGASIGKYFFIDHGTGIVVGETTTIGEHVKLYQGVTLGALSTKGGQHLKSTKRHPTIGDRVTIYSGASILGGDTVIGDDVVIGGNAFITSSVEAGTRVSIKSPELIYKNRTSAQKKEADESPWVYPN